MLSFIFRHPLLLAVGVALMVLAFYLTWRKHNLLLSGHLTNGEVVELIPHQGSKGGTNYSLRVNYAQLDGTKSEFITSFSSNPPLHQLGEKVRVIIYPGAEKPDIMAFPDLFLLPWICFCAGTFILMMCIGFIFGPGVIDAVYLPHLSHPDPLKTLNLLK